MAVTRAGSVIKVTADNDTIPGPIKVCGIKYIAGTTSSFTLKAGSTSGNELYFVDGDADVFEEVHFRESGTVHVDMAGTGGELYIYTK
jgi:hypothetical protein